MATSSCCRSCQYCTLPAGAKGWCRLRRLEVHAELADLLGLAPLSVPTAAEVRHWDRTWGRCSWSSREDHAQRLHIYGTWEVGMRCGSRRRWWRWRGGGGSTCGAQFRRFRAWIGRVDGIGGFRRSRQARRKIRQQPRQCFPHSECKCAPQHADASQSGWARRAAAEEGEA